MTDEIALPSGDTMRTARRYDDVRQVLTDPRFSRDMRRAHGKRMVRGRDVSDDPHSLLNMDPPEHTRIRRIVAGAFKPRRIARRRPRVLAITRELAGEMAASGPPADLVGEFAFPLPVRVICELLGIPDADRDRFRVWADTMLSMSDADAEQRVQAGREFRAYIREHLAAHRAHPGEALLDDLIAARDGSDALSERELVSLTSNLIVAGHETTANLIASGVFTLLSEGLYRGLAPTERLVEELLRHDTPALYALPRVATRDVDLPSGTVAAGETVLPLLAEANRDSGVFGEPDGFDADRDGPAHLAFGHGAHFCLGAGLARLEAEVALTVLLAEFPDLALAVPAEDVPWRTTSLVRGPTRLPVRW
ncbi:cytochrome P450 [Actinomadura darangshiensis]|uniref:Cytochrome P450 n=1 Tax=Actinomadura darangshiensis TaxID=705336 RepID=A0A4R5BHE3_9ACTN|nr:cytochrome P450 [Actinomadura darangshiensis]TDD85901.1 cytochrome P450 [Actinomadura darangshiensis]